MFFNSKHNYEVRTLGDSVLHGQAKAIGRIDESVRDLAAAMVETLQAFEGIGLAAPQVGVGVRLVVLDIPEHCLSQDQTPGEVLLMDKMPVVLINPEIVAYGLDKEFYNEGCLSIPEIYADVERPRRVILKSETLNYGVIECECGGLLARCIQHELDHLGGVTFVDRLDKLEAQRIDKQLRSLRRFGAKHNYTRRVKR